MTRSMSTCVECPKGLEMLIHQKLGRCVACMRLSLAGASSGWLLLVPCRNSTSAPLILSITTLFSFLWLAHLFAYVYRTEHWKSTWDNRENSSRSPFFWAVVTGVSEMLMHSLGMNVHPIKTRDTAGLFDHIIRMIGSSMPRRRILLLAIGLLASDRSRSKKRDTCDQDECILSGPLGTVMRCCGDDCVDVRSDISHCGLCFNPCGGDNPACCDLVCKDLDNDTQHCGGCNQACNWPPGSQMACCSGNCTNLNDTLDHCGHCNNDCSSSGRVYPHCCHGRCVDLASDLSNCGYCGHNCKQDEQCISGLCQPRSSVDFHHMKADRRMDGVNLSWETGAEMETAGFHIYRSNTPEGPYNRINKHIIKANRRLQGSRYTYRDRIRPEGNLFYKVEWVKANGSTRITEPFAALQIQ